MAINEPQPVSQDAEYARRQCEDARLEVQRDLAELTRKITILENTPDSTKRREAVADALSLIDDVGHKSRRLVDCIEKILLRFEQLEPPVIID